MIPRTSTHRSNSRSPSIYCKQAADEDQASSSAFTSQSRNSQAAQLNTKARRLLRSAILTDLTSQRDCYIWIFNQEKRLYRPPMNATSHILSTINHRSSAHHHISTRRKVLCSSTHRPRLQQNVLLGTVSCVYTAIAIVSEIVKSAWCSSSLAAQQTLCTSIVPSLQPPCVKE